MQVKFFAGKEEDTYFRNDSISGGTISQNLCPDILSRDLSCISLGLPILNRS